MRRHAIMAAASVFALLQMGVGAPAWAFKMATDEQENNMTEQQHEEYVSKLLGLLVEQCKGEVIPEHLVCFIRSENKFYDLGPDGKLKPYTGDGVFR